MLLPVQTSAGRGQVTGYVTSENGQPLAIVLIGTQLRVFTLSSIEVLPLSLMFPLESTTPTKGCRDGDKVAP